MLAVFFFVLFTCGHTYSQRLTMKNVVVVVLNQPDSHDLMLTDNLIKSIHNQARALKEDAPVIHISTLEFPHPGAWTVIPLIPWLDEVHGRNSSFILFCQSKTNVDLKRLIEFLQKLDQKLERFLGYALYDRDATIIHHFAFPKRSGHFKYPSFAAGFVFSQALLKRLAQRIRDGDLPEHPDFSIDASYELSLYIYNKGRGIELTHVEALCVKPGPHCALRPTNLMQCGDAVSKQEIFFAVKTCSKYHLERLPIVKNTWAIHTKQIGFFSDIEDSNLGTTNLGVPNTDRGHCGKTQAIMQYVFNQSVINHKIKWLVIADDDTILSVGRLQLLLSCYGANTNTAIGERYGYRVVLPENFGGYNYISGGGGMVFSLPLVRDILENCDCPSDSTPDDMYLGICLANLNVPISHSALFHQARPNDYAADYLLPQEPISFHKHWMVDPLQVYKDWFYHIDMRFSEREQHSEL